MSLLSQRTNLKSLRYGKDRPGGGSSNQPYIVSGIPGDPSSFSTLPKELKFLDKVVGAGKNIIDFAGTDFFLRGGSSAVSRAAKDVSRLSQMFADFKSPNGFLFAAKQNVLSLTGVKTQASGIINEGIYLPTSTVLQAAGNAFGVHLNKQGLNPFRKTTPSEGFIGGLFEFTGPLGLPTYAQTVKSNQTSTDNRLVQLKNVKITSPFVASVNLTREQRQTQRIIDRGVSQNERGERRAQVIRARNAGTLDQLRDDRKESRQSAREAQANERSQNKNNIPRNDSDVLLRYSGGPNSLLGIGQTTIRRYSNTADGLDFAKNPNFKGKYFVLNSAQIDERLSSKLEVNISDFREDLIEQQTVSDKKNILSISPKYSNPNNRIETRFRLGDPGKRNKDVTNYVSGLSNGALDKVNSYLLYKSGTPYVNATYLNQSSPTDLCQFRIGIIDNKTPQDRVYIHFRAFLDSMDDNYTAEWNPFKYMGRGENFYRYNGFTRTINLGWTVAAQSKQELIPMYQKLNFLASSLAPDYSDKGYMRGNLATLTVGGYLYEQPGIITSINYSVPQESPWEIAIGNGDADIDQSVKELPHIIKVTGFQFIPIHEFVPRKQQNEYDATNNNFLKSFGDERYIALEDATTNNYDTGIGTVEAVTSEQTMVEMGSFADPNKMTPR